MCRTFKCEDLSTEDIKYFCWDKSKISPNGYRDDLGSGRAGNVNANSIKVACYCKYEYEYASIYNKVWDILDNTEEPTDCPEGKELVCEYQELYDIGFFPDNPYDPFMKISGLASGCNINQECRMEITPEYAKKFRAMFLNDNYKYQQCMENETKKCIDSCMNDLAREINENNSINFPDSPDVYCAKKCDPQTVIEPLCKDKITNQPNFNFTYINKYPRSIFLEDGAKANNSNNYLGICEKRTICENELKSELINEIERFFKLNFGMQYGGAYQYPGFYQYLLELEDCYLGFKYFKVTSLLDKDSFYRKYCEGYTKECYVSYENYIEKEKVDFIRYYDKKDDSIKETEGKMRTIISPSDIVQCRVEFETYPENLSYPIHVKIKFNNVIKEAECSKRAFIYLYPKTSGGRIEIEGKEISTEKGVLGKEAKYYKRISLDYGSGFPIEFAIKDNKIYYVRDNKIKEYNNENYSIVITYSDGYVCSQLFSTSNEDRGKNYSCEVTEINVGKTNINPKELFKSNSKSSRYSFVSEDIVIARYLYFFVNVKGTAEIIIPHTPNITSDVVSKPVLLGYQTLDVPNYLVKNQYNFYKSISEINQKISNAGKMILFEKPIKIPYNQTISAAFRFLYYMSILSDMVMNDIEQSTEKEIINKFNKNIITHPNYELGDRIIFLPIGSTIISTDPDLTYFFNPGEEFNLYSDSDDSLGFVKISSNPKSFYFIYLTKKTFFGYDTTTLKKRYSDVLAHELGHSYSFLRDEYLYSVYFHISSILAQNALSIEDKEFKEKILFYSMNPPNPFPICCTKRGNYSCARIIDKKDEEDDSFKEAWCYGMPYEKNWITKDEIPPGNEPYPLGPLNSVMGGKEENDSVIYPIEATCPLRNC